MPISYQIFNLIICVYVLCNYEFKALGFSQIYNCEEQTTYIQHEFVKQQTKIVNISE